MNLVERLEAFGRHDIAVAGGKGAGLGDLIAAGLPVPPGFVITTDAYREVVARNGIQGAILAAQEHAHTSDPASLEAAASTIGAYFEAATIPPDLEERIVLAYAELAATAGEVRRATCTPDGACDSYPQVAVAVRSSATAEDLEGASFAGQQETFLNIVGTTDLLAAIRRCWASLWSGPAIAYRRREGIEAPDVALAVVVQVLVPADSAGVLFTADPVTGRRDHVVIDATWGLGEALVAGQVTPDHLVIDKATGGSVREQIADKRVMTVRRAHGVETVAMEPGRRTTPVLDEAQVGQLLAIARTIEAHTGRPSDVEWVSHEGRIHLTQARAITALPPDLLGMEWSRQMLIERYPDPLTPLTWSAVSSTFFASLRATMEALGGELRDDVPIIKLIHGRAYINVTAFQAGMQSLPLRAPVETTNGRAPGLRTSDRRTTGRGARPRPSAAMASAGLGVARLVLRTHRDWERRLPGYVTTIRAQHGTDWSQVSTGELLAARQTQTAALVPMLDNHARAIVAADLIVQALAGLIKKWVGDSDGQLVLTLLSGLTGNLTVRTNRALWALAQLDRNTPEFAAALGDFLATYGHRSPRYEFAHPTWGERPEQVLELVDLVAAGSPDPGVGEARRRADRHRATAEVRARLSPLRRTVFDQILTLAQTYFRLRENQQFYLVMGVPTMRAIVLELGSRFAAAGLVRTPQDVFLLKGDEVDAIAADLASGRSLQTLAVTDPLGLVIERSLRLDVHRRTPAPLTVGAVPQTVILGDDDLRGTGASAGEASGRARLVRGPEDFASVRPGDILVAPATSPGWTPLFGVVAGLVTEFGGLLSHAGVVAREYGLPAVLGVPDAMARICDGEQVTINGSTGRVVRLGRDAAALADDRGAVS